MSLELDRLIEMHTYRRPAGSKAERKFTHRYLVPFGCTRDRFGNWTKVIGDNPRHVWSCHTDTVHRDGGRQKLRLDADGILSALHAGDCLGADDTAGVWLMCELLRRKVPGRYVFHFGEEQGCIGSKALVRSAPAWIDETDMVIALDRKDTGDIITHQCGMRTASDAFAESLALQLGGDYMPCEWGMYTDSESYADVVAECTNLSVGYHGQHSRAEVLDTHHALALLERLTALDIGELIVSREPGDDDFYDGPTYRGIADDNFWSRYADTTTPVVRLDGANTIYQCRDCRETCKSYYTVCLHCGADNPARPQLARMREEEETDDAIARHDAYLDRIYGDVQVALRADMKRRMNGNKKGSK